MKPEPSFADQAQPWEARNKRVASNQDNDPKEGEPAVFRSPGFAANLRKCRVSARVVNFQTSADRDQLLVNTQLPRRRDLADATKSGVNKTHALCSFFPMKTSEIGIATASVPGASRFVLRLALRSMKIYNKAGISIMQVSKWGNSLAVRLPATVVEALDLKEGDEIEISVAGKRDFKVARDRSTERALEQLRQMKWSFPPDFKFNREEINER